MGRAGRLLDGLLTSLLQWCSSPCSSCLLIVSTETPKSRAGSLTWAHAQRTPFSDSSGDLGHQHDATHINPPRFGTAVASRKTPRRITRRKESVV